VRNPVTSAGEALVVDDVLRLEVVTRLLVVVRVEEIVEDAWEGVELGTLLEEA